MSPILQTAATAQGASPLISIFVVLAIVCLLIFLMGKAVYKAERKTTPDKIPHPVFVSGLLCFSILANVLSIITTLSNENYAVWMKLFLCLCGIICILSIVLLFKWKKLGMWIIVGISIVSCGVLYFSTANSSALLGLIAPCIWYIILTRVKCNNGKSCWEMMC